MNFSSISTFVTCDEENCHVETLRLKLSSHMTFVTMWRSRFFSRHAPHKQTLKMLLIAAVIGWKVRPAPPDPNKEKPAVHKRINRGKYTHFERCSVCSRRSKYLSLIPISNNSQSNHRIIALCCYLQHISLRMCLHTHADTHTRNAVIARDYQ